jgi:hypothetical protein
VLDEKMDAIVRAEETKIALEKFTQSFQTNMTNLTFDQKKFLIDLLVESIEVTVVASQLNLHINLRFDQSRMTENTPVCEPKKGSPEPQSGTEKPNNESYGATSRT